LPANADRSGHDIVVVGASAGGVEALRALVAELPGDLAAALFVVLHVAPLATSVLPKILTGAGELPAVHAEHGQAILPSTIYVAPPDRHMLVEPGQIRLTIGPRENGHRPAVDPLFRTASASYGARVVGVVMSGVLDDGTAGLSVIKHRGGATLVQDPAEALYPMMPTSAIEGVTPDRVLDAQGLAAAIVELARTPVDGDVTPRPPDEPVDTDTLIDIDRSASDHPRPGAPSGLSCPECGGGLWETTEAEITRFRCRTGHGYALESLVADQSEALEGALWAALRALEERGALARQMAMRFESRGHRATSGRWERRAARAVQQAMVVHDLLRRLHPDSEPALVAAVAEESH
jgi:two-component system chemotaxis response regulator CheB